MPDLMINDVAAFTGYGIVVADIEGWLDGPQKENQRGIVPGRPGTIRLRNPQEMERPLTIRGLVRGTTAFDVRTRFDTLKNALEGSTVKFAMPDGAGRHIYAAVELVSSPLVAGQFARKDLPVEIRAIAEFPYFLSDTLTSVGGGVAMPLGTAPVTPLLSLTGAAATGITFTLRNNLAATVATLTFPQLTLIAGDVFVIDNHLMTARKNGANQLALLATTSDFFLVDPKTHADYPTSAWPSIITSAGTLTVSYRRAWR
ncbi:MAG: hypothetical protein H0U59_12650 [Gemmatimonadaceae bacterium]|nr:hypothetical protein [Gemmatimonadaceae bacterium]